MLRVTVVGCDAFRAAFLVGTDVLQRIKAELFAEHGEEFHGGIVCAFCRRSCRSEVTASEACPGSIFDAGWNVKGHYNNHEFNIPNNIGFNNEKGLYDITKELLDTIKGED